jgi:integrase
MDQALYHLSQQKASFSALLFLYREVLGIDMSEWNIQALRAKERKHIPVVLTRKEVRRVIDNLDGIYQLIVKPKSTKRYLRIYSGTPMRPISCNKESI